MSLFLMSKIRKLENGQSVKLTKGDLAQVHINLSDAKKNLSPEIFQQIANLYDKYRQDKSSEIMDMKRFNMLAHEIIDEFEKIAPWRLYNSVK